MKTPPVPGSMETAHGLRTEAEGRLAVAARVPFEANTETSVCAPEGRDEVHTA